MTASFVKEAGIDVNKPETATPDPQEHANIFVAISENNEIWIEGHLIDPRAIRAYIERQRAENPNGAVVIQAHQRSYTNTLVQVMDASRQAGVYNISMAANTG